MHMHACTCTHTRVHKTAQDKKRREWGGRGGTDLREQLDVLGHSPCALDERHREDAERVEGNRTVSLSLTLHLARIVDVQSKIVDPHVNLRGCDGE